MYLLYIFVVPFVLLAGTILLTLAVEYPIIYNTGITRNKKYIVAVNALTNVCLNVGVVTVFTVNMLGNGRDITNGINIWTLFAELVLIPVTEAILYFKISKESSTKVLLVTYAANFASFLIGLFIVGLFTTKSIHGISSFFVSLFGGGVKW
ncbi:MAG: hypothetical protein IKR39_00365 [Lachnospiraceae bacterium]|nr:hypothetical protein [Lachnospiraceae bacterium]